jgi:hypothetical protein
VAQTSLDETLRWETISDLASQKAPPYLIGGAMPLPKNEPTLLYGDGGVGKSAMMHQLAVCIATGTPFLGEDTTAGRVLYLDFENSRTATARRIRATAKALGVDLGDADRSLQLICLAGHYLNAADVASAIVAKIDQFKPVLVVIDGYQSGFDVDVIDGQQVGRTYQVMRRFCEGGSTVVCIHHVSRTELEAARRGKVPSPGGNQQVINQARAAYYLAEDSITLKKDNHGIPRTKVPLIRRVHEEDGAVLFDTGSTKPATAKRSPPKVKPADRVPSQIVSYVSEQGGQVSQADVKRHFAKLWGVKAGQVGRGLTEMQPRLEALGVVFEGPSNAPRLRLVSS